MASVDNAGVLCEPAESCMLCNAPGDSLYSALTDRLFDAPGTWSLRRCRDCQLIWLDPQPLQDEIGKLYRSYYTHAANDERYSSTGFKRAIKQGLSLLFFWTPVFRSDYFYLSDMPAGRVLEIGCGSGGFLSAIAQRGWQATGLDFDPAAIAMVREQTNVSASVGELRSINYDNGHFDAIVMNNVIEHVWNPQETLTECYRILRPEGRLVILTPNSGSLGHEIFGRHWRGLEPPRHLYIYDAKSLEQICRNAGFSKLNVFSSPGGSVADAMLHSSAALAGLKINDGDVWRVVSKEWLLSLIGNHRGEWIISIAAR